MSASVILAGCTDTDIAKFAVEKPQTIADMEYLNEYDALKSYVDRTASPNFKLGTGASAADYNSKGIVYRLVNANYDEMTAGNEMKYSYCVAEDGTMDFSTVSSLVENARSAGVSIFGHTLCWHAQQQNKYLNGLIADKNVEPDPSTANPVLHINTSAAKENPWDWEIYYDLDTPLTIGQEYTISMRTKASSATSFPFWPGLIDGSETHYLPSFSASEQWGTSSITFTPTAAIERLRFCFGQFGGDLYFDDVVLTATGSDVNLINNSSFDEDDLTGWSKASWVDYTYRIERVTAGVSGGWENLVSNADCESDDVSCFYATEIGVGPNPATIGAAGTGADGAGHAIVVHSGDNPANTWDTQFFVKVPYTFQQGEAYRFSMKVRADKNATAESQAHNEPGGYLRWAMVGSPNITTEWQEYTNSGVIAAEQNGMNTIAFNLAVLPEANTYYFDDIHFEIEKAGDTVPMTPEEKKTVLTEAMESWIKGMMETTGDYVKSWDVVNEPISGDDNDGDGIYDLWSVDHVSADDAANNFYWRDYLGDEDLVRLPVKFARQYFAENGGSPSDLKLFINDYNLESDWDDNKKLKSLIEWIKRWEADGTTQIDGIGSQMHVSCFADPATQQSKEEHVVKMLELLAASGKLVKISELDMGYVDAAGNAVKTADMTEEQHKAMSDYYKFIVKKYFEIIPANQQYGITHWSPTDAGDASYDWRAGEPIGLWDRNYNRKHVYAGFADGLAGKE